MTGECGMNTKNGTEVLVREGIQQTVAPKVAPITYPVASESASHVDDLLVHIAEMRSALSAGNVEMAIRIGHLVAGWSARVGERRVASLVRQAVTMSRFYVLEQAGEKVAEAEAALISKN